MAPSEKTSGKAVERYSEDSDCESSTDSDWSATAPSRPYRRRRILSVFVAVFSILGASYFLIIYLIPNRLEVGELQPAATPESDLAPGDANWLARPLLIDDDPGHVLITPQPLSKPSPILRPLTSRLPYDALVRYFVDGTIPSHFTKHPTPSLDITYTWVNATSFYLDEARQDRLEDEDMPPQRGAKKHWRENGELRGAIRSATASLGKGLGTVHVISGDYPLFPRVRVEPLNETEEAETSSEMSEEIDVEEDVEFDGLLIPHDARVGQIPTWLNWQSRSSKLQWHFHSDLWRLPRSDDGRVPEGMLGFDGSDRDTFELEKAWRDVSLPSFNSFAIEARLGSVAGLSEQFIMSNDDMFFLKDMSTTDFFHPLYGSVLRLESHPNLAVKPALPTNLRTSSGEWGGLQYANVILSRRFPNRPRMYIYHQPKHLSLPLVHEAEIMFATELTEAATRGFRESKRGVADIEFAWLVTHLRIERWREALLWSWAVAKMGDGNGRWAADANTEVARILGLDLEDLNDRVYVASQPRSTLADYESVNSQAGWENPMATKYHFSSFDGHMPARPEYSGARTCQLSLQRCFPPDFFSGSGEVSATDMFKHLAFAAPECGDCFISALVNDSGPRGLSAFLPSPEKIFTPPPQLSAGLWDRDEPILPLTGDWLSADFNLASVVRAGQDVWTDSPARPADEVNLRDWSIKLLSRYTYLWSSTPSHFAQIHSPSQMSTALAQYGAASKWAMACLNDDQPDYVGTMSKAILSSWMEQRWGSVSAVYEKPGYSWHDD